MEKLVLRSEYITLGQLLKAQGLVDKGSDAREVILNGEASVNGEVETRRGRKLYEGDHVSFRGTEISVVR